MSRLSLTAIVLVLATPTLAVEPQQGYIELFRHDAYGGSKRTVAFGENIADFRSVKWDDARDNIHDKVSSYRYVIPEGWEVRLCIDINGGKPDAVLRGSGEVPKLFLLNDKFSSLRWDRIPEKQ